MQTTKPGDKLGFEAVIGLFVVVFVVLKKCRWKLRGDCCGSLDENENNETNHDDVDCRCVLRF